MQIIPDPDRDACFGDGLTRDFLEHMLGYSDFLMGCIKRLAEQEGNRGLLDRDGDCLFFFQPLVLK